MTLIIKNIDQLKAEQKRLEEKKRFLEAGIRSKVTDIKERLSPKANAGLFFSRFFNRKKEEESSSDWLADTLSDLAARMAKKYTAKAEEKFRSWFSK